MADKNECYTCKHRKTPNDDPGKAKVFVGLKRGDTLYAMDDIENAVHAVTVIYVDSDGHAFVSNGYFQDWADSEYCQTKRDALLNRVNEELAYCMPRVNFANAALKAIVDGGDISEFLDGMDE